MLVLLAACLRARHPVARACRLALVVAALSAAPRLGCAQRVPRLAARQAPVAAAGEARVTAVRAAAPVALDGRLDDAAWRAARAATGFVQQRPDPGAAATQRTEARILYDDGALYVGMRMHDDDPDGILAPLGRRDSDGTSDWAHVVIDSYRDRRTAFHFAVSPSGVRRDGFVSGDAESSEDLGWDAVWDAAVARDSAGWTAEMRIPLSQLRFAADSEIVFGIQFARDLARRGERSTWAPLPPDAAGFVSRFGTLDGLAGVAARRRLEVVPYSVARLTSEPGEAGDPFRGGATLGGALGADLRYGVGPSLTLTATANPDFGQVEADPSEVNLTGLETFRAERRPFFVEGSDIFGFPLADAEWLVGPSRLFHSRRIGRAPQGEAPDGARHAAIPEATRLLGAAKLSGKTAGGWSLGVLGAVTDEMRGRWVDAEGARREGVVEPMTAYGAARVARDFDEGRSSVGAVLTTTTRRLGGTGLDRLRASAVVGGVDARRRTASHDFGGYIVASRVAGSAEAIAETQRGAVHYFQRPDARLRLDDGRTSLGGVAAELRAWRSRGTWRWGGTTHYVTPGFEANDLGYHARADLWATTTWLGYRQMRPSRLTSNWELWTNQWLVTTARGERTVTGANLFARAQLHSQWEVRGELRHELDGLDVTAMRGGPAVRVPASTYGALRLRPDPRRAVGPGVFARGSRDRDGGRMLHVQPSLTVRAAGRMELSIEPALTWSRAPAQYVETVETADGTHHVAGSLAQRTASLTTRLAWTFTPRLTFQLYAQPFLSAGDFGALRELRDARARALGARFRGYAATQVARGGDGTLSVDRDGDGRGDFTLDDPDFGVGELRANAVLRWEWRPGSALFLVWSQGREADDGDGRLDVGRDARRLLDARATNVVLLKLSWWLDA